MSEPKAPIDLLIDREVEFTPIEGALTESRTGLPYATHEGVLRIGELALRVYQLNTGEQVIDAGDVARFFGVEVEDEEE